MGGTHRNKLCSSRNPDQSQVIAMEGDLRKTDSIREFWQLAIELLALKPTALWINFTKVSFADTKLAACIIAIIRRAREMGIRLFIIGSSAVEEVLLLCKIPPLQQFTKVA
jgi:anti-anti-sigma regulatory factor